MELTLTEILIAVASPLLGIAALVGLMHYLAKFHNESRTGQRRVQFTIRTLLLVVLGAAVLTYVYRDTLLRLIDGGFGASHSRITNVTNVRQLNEALAAERCILLIDVDWDLYSAETHQVVEQFLRNRYRYESVPKVPVYCVNITDFEGPVFESLSSWSATAMPHATRGVYVGTGPLLWVQRGVVKERLAYGDGLNVETLVEKTRRAFLVGSAHPTRLDDCCDLVLTNATHVFFGRISPASSFSSVSRTPRESAHRRRYSESS